MASDDDGNEDDEGRFMSPIIIWLDIGYTIVLLLAHFYCTIVYIFKDTRFYCVRLLSLINSSRVQICDVP